MNETTVVNLYKEPYDVYIGRAGKGKDGYFGNPFSLPAGADDVARLRCLEDFTKYLIERWKKDDTFRHRLLELRGKRLGCFCKPKTCHGDVIADFVDLICTHGQPGPSYGGHCQYCDTGQST